MTEKEKIDEERVVNWESLKNISQKKKGKGKEKVGKKITKVQENRRR